MAAWVWGWRGWGEHERARRGEGAGKNEGDGIEHGIASIRQYLTCRTTPHHDHVVKKNNIKKKLQFVIQLYKMSLQSITTISCVGNNTLIYVSKKKKTIH